MQENEELNYDDFLRALDNYGSNYDHQMHTPMRPGSSRSAGANLVDKVKQQIS